MAIIDAATQKVANYWQGLVNSGVIRPEPSWSTQWLTDMNKGNVVGWCRPSGHPTSSPRSAEHGGQVGCGRPPGLDRRRHHGRHLGREAEVVTANSKHPQQAAEFINWMNNSQEGLNLLIKNVAVFPAATFARTSPALSTPPRSCRPSPATTR